MPGALSRQQIDQTVECLPAVVAQRRRSTESPASAPGLTVPRSSAALLPSDTPSSSERIVLGLAPLLALYALYTLIRWLVAGRGPIAGEMHAAWVLKVERWLRIDWELDMQRAALAHTWLVKAANWYYVFGFLPVLTATGALAAWRAPDAFRRWRRVFAISLMLALTGYAFFPLTPPRLLPAAHGYVDTLLLYGPHYYGDATGSSLFNAYGSIPSLVNVYAAMPSMHVAWSVIASILLCTIVAARWWVRMLATLHPVFMAGAVVITANHYLLDVVGGLIVLLTAVWLARRWDRRAHQRGIPGANARCHQPDSLW